MSASLAPAAPRSRTRPLRSTAAVIAAIVANVLLTTVTDQLFHLLGVYPPWGQPMFDPGDNALALGYRLVYGVLGGWLAARLAPHAPMRHALVYGAVGFVLSALGAVVAITSFDLGPDWYPLLLVATALPCAWLGGRLFRTP